MMRLNVLPAAALLFAATPALAQPSAGGWTGPYVGGHVGVGLLDNDRSTIAFDTNLDGNFGDTVRTAAGANAFSPGFCSGRAYGSQPASGCDSVEDRLEFGAHAGFDFDLGGFVVGAVAEFDRNKIRDSVSAFSTTPASYTMTRTLRSSYGLRARVGVPVGGAALIYATAGATNGRFRHSFSTTNTANTFAVTDRRTSNWGYRAGGGAEYRLASNFSIGGQYLYSSIKDDDSRISVARGTAPATNPFVLVNPAGTQFQRTDERFRMHSVQLTGNFRF